MNDGSPEVERVWDPWTTGDRALDRWVAEFITDQHVLRKLAERRMEVRFWIATMCRGRQPRLVSPANYMAGCLKRLPRSWTFFVPGRVVDQDIPGGSLLAQPTMVHTPYGAFPSAQPSLVSDVPVAEPEREPEPARPMPRPACAAPASSADTGEHDNPRSPRDVPVWASDLAEAVGSRSRFLKLLCGKLKDCQVEWLHRASPELQYRLGVAMLFQSPLQDSLQSAFAQVKSTFESMGKPGYGLHAAGASPGRARLQVVAFGEDLSAPVVAVHLASKLAAEHGGTAKAPLIKMWLFHDHRKGCDFEDRLLRAHDNHVHHGHGYRQGLELMSRFAAQWTALADHVLIVVVCPVGIHRATARCASQHAPLGVDASSSSLSMLARGVQGFLNANPSLRVSTFLACADSQTVDLERELDSIFGQSTVADPLRHNSPLPVYLVRSSARLGEARSSASPWSPHGTINGMVWCGGECLDRVRRGEVARMSSSIMTAVQAQISGPSDGSDAAQAQREMIMARPVLGGAARLQETRIWLCLAGLQHGSFHDSLLEMLPCYVNIRRSTGTPAGTAEADDPTVCGRERWCTNCETLIRWLLRTPHVGLLVDYMRDHLAAVMGAAQCDSVSVSRRRSYSEISASPTPANFPHEEDRPSLRRSRSTHPIQ